MNVTGNVAANVSSSRRGGRDSRSRATMATPDVASITPYARYVGRVGALAVALGVGIAVATGQGLGIARAETDQPTDSQSTDASSATENAVSESADPTVAAHDPSGPPESGRVLDSKSVPQMNHDSSGGLIEPSDEDVSSDDELSGVGVDQEPEREKPAPTPSESSPRAPDLPSPPQGSAARSNHGVVRHDSKPSAPDGNAGRASSRQDVAERDEVNAEPARGQRGFFTVQELSSGQQLMAVASYEPVRTAAEVESSEPAAESSPGVMISYATKWVGAVFSAFLAPSPTSPTQPPLVWAMLTWAGREVQQTFANRTSIGAVETVATSAIAATPYEEATALLEQARHLEGQADAQRAIAAQIYQHELNKADAQWTQARIRYVDAEIQLKAGELDAARARIEQARNLEEQAQAQRAIGVQIYNAEIAKAKALFTQADIRRQAAQQLFQQAGLTRKAQAEGQRLQGVRHRWNAALSADQGAFNRQLAAAAGARAKTERQTAQVIRTSTTDATLRDLATRLSEQATANQSEGSRLANEAIALEFRAHVSRLLANLHFQFADRLDPAGAPAL